MIAGQIGCPVLLVKANGLGNLPKIVEIAFHSLFFHEHKAVEVAVHVVGGLNYMGKKRIACDLGQG